MFKRNWELFSIGAIVTGLLLLIFASTMGRESRNQVIVQEGYDAAKNEIPPTACQYSSAKNDDWQRRLWMEGYQQYIRDQR